MGKSLRILFIIVGISLLFAWITYTLTKPITGDVVGLDAGMCDQVDSDPITGEKLVFCCLDELYLFQKNSLTKELAIFGNELDKVAAQPMEDAISFFLSPYQSTLHQQYEWQSACGKRVPCDICILGPQCGNNVIQRKEQCDDGNRKDGDGCSSRCKVEPEECGNGRMEGEEECDDGNIQDGDGCSALCISEEQYIPVLVTECGNGILEHGEECEDGNTIAGDGCSDTCTQEESLPIEDTGDHESGPEEEVLPPEVEVEESPPEEIPLPEPIQEDSSFFTDRPVAMPVQQDIAGNTGPAAVIFGAAGAAAGIGWIRRKKMKN